MAYFGLSKPWMGALNENTGTYSDFFKCGKAISTTVTPAYNEAQLYGDNQQIENVKEFKNATVALGTDTLPKAAAKTLFGHTINADNSEIHKTGDSGRYVGYGFIVQTINGGVKQYQACFLPKVQFSEGEEAYQTKGDNITFATPSLSGVAMGTTTENWREKSPLFDTEDEADTWIQKKLGVIPTCAAPVASVKGGDYDAAQTVELTCATPEAAIYYTLNGTTPSKTNGTRYTAAISVTETAGLRAVAVRDNYENSSVTVEEYIIAA